MKNFKFLAALFLAPVIWLPVNVHAGWVESMIGEIVEQEVEKFFVPDTPPTIVDINYSGTKRVNNQLFIAGNATLAADGVGEGLELLHAVRWTGESEIEDLGSLAGPTGTSRAFDISGDGSVIVGETELPSGVIHAFRWTD